MGWRGDKTVVIRSYVRVVIFGPKSDGRFSNYNDPKEKAASSEIKASDAYRSLNSLGYG